MNIFKKCCRFIYLNARPIDLARWQYHFEEGSKDNVLKMLTSYQNKDGGFGYALEADCFNPNSSPIQTWAATEILKEINFDDKNHTIIQGILKYLSSGQDFNKTLKQWENTIASNNDYPHAIWWTYNSNKGSEYKYNPTASLAGFFLKYGDKNHPFYSTAINIVKEAYNYWIASMPYNEQHVTNCFINMYDYLSDTCEEIVDMKEFKKKLIDQVKYEIDSALDEWGINYVCMPSDFIKSKDSIFYLTNKESVQKECNYIINHQLEDGSFPVSWKWWTDYKEFEISQNWWKAQFCIRYMRFLKEFSQ